MASSTNSEKDLKQRSMYSFGAEETRVARRHRQTQILMASSTDSDTDLKQCPSLHDSFGTEEITKDG